MLPSSELFRARFRLVNAKAVKFVVDPGGAYGAAVGIVVDAKAHLLVPVPEALVLPSICPLHDPKAVNLVVCVVTLVVLVVLWPVVEPEATDVVILPLSFVRCTVFPFFRSEASFCSVNEISLEVIALCVLLLAKAMLLVHLEFSNVEVTVTVDELAHPVGATQREHALVLDAVGHFKSA